MVKKKADPRPGEFEKVAHLKYEDRLTRKNNGEPEACLHNAYICLVHDKGWKGVLGFDEFSQRTIKLFEPPYAGGCLGEWTDDDDSRTSVWLTSNNNLKVATLVCSEAVQMVAKDNPFHPVKDYLDSLKWDKYQRLRVWLSAFLGAGKWAKQDNEKYLERVGTMWMISAVARIYRPGCKADHVLILEGQTGLGKSSALGILAGEWFSDTPFILGDKDSYQMLRGKWIIEMPELDAFNKADASRAKAFFSSSCDNYRESFGRRNKDFPRQCVFAGSTNQNEYFKDSTGNRRYWPVVCSKLDMDELIAERDQLWAEAVYLYKQGEQWWPTVDDHPLLVSEQSLRDITDAWVPIIGAWLDSDCSEFDRTGSPEGKKITTQRVLLEALKIEKGRIDERSMTTRAGRALRQLGYTKKQGPDRGKCVARHYYVQAKWD